MMLRGLVGWFYRIFKEEEEERKERYDVKKREPLGGGGGLDSRTLERASQTKQWCRGILPGREMKHRTNGLEDSLNN